MFGNNPQSAVRGFKEEQGHAGLDAFSLSETLKRCAVISIYAVEGGSPNESVMILNHIGDDQVQESLSLSVTLKAESLRCESMTEEEQHGQDNQPIFRANYHFHTTYR